MNLFAPRPRARLAALFLLLGSLAACTRTEVGCSSEDAKAVVTGLVKQALEKSTADKIREADASAAVSRSKIRAAIAQLGIFLEDIRTSKQDPNSTKRFCEGKLKLRFPVEVIDAADRARSDAQLGSVSQLADQSDVEQQANSFHADFEYDVQPTDEGDKVYGEIQTGTPVLNFASEVLASSLLRAAIQQASIANQQAEQAAQAQQQAALNEQKAANLAAAKADDQLANQAIGAVWRALPNDTRAQLLAQQRAWARKKDADCKVEAASASIDPTEIEIARLTCDARVTRERTGELQQYRTEEPAAAPSDDGGSGQDL